MGGSRGGPEANPRSDRTRAKEIRRAKSRRPPSFGSTRVFVNAGRLLRCGLAGRLCERHQLRDVALNQRLDLIVDLIEARHLYLRDDGAKLRNVFLLHIESRLLDRDYFVELLLRVGVGEVIVLGRKILELFYVAVFDSIHTFFIGVVDRPELRRFIGSEIHVGPYGCLALRAGGRDVELLLRRLREGGAAYS